MWSFDSNPFSFLFASSSTRDPAHRLQARGHSKNQMACLFCKRIRFTNIMETKGNSSRPLKYSWKVSHLKPILKVSKRDSYTRGKIIYSICLQRSIFLYYIHSFLLDFWQVINSLIFVNINTYFLRIRYGSVSINDVKMKSLTHVNLYCCAWHRSSFQRLPRSYIIG